MKIVVPAIGSRGDVQPYIALCQGLQRAGHQTILATNPTLCALVGSYGVTSAAVGPPVDMGLEAAKLWAGSGNNMWLGLIKVMRMASRLIEQAYPDILELCREADLVIVSDPTAGAAEAEQLGIPWISATLQPARIPVANPEPAVMQRAMGALVWPIFGRLMVAPINRYRRRVGAPLVKDIGSMQSERLILIPASPQVVPDQQGWPAHVRLTGYWMAEPPGEWTPPDSLVDFLESGPPPVAISLGAMSLFGKQTHQAARITLAALEKTGLRAVIQGWEAALEGVDLPATVYHAGSMPHTWLFERVSVVVHHGGFGTTGSTFTAGVPGVIVPHIIDQFYWAQRAHEIGASPPPLPRARLSVERLAQALDQAVNEAALREKASEIGRQIRAEPDGVEVTVELIEAVVG